MHGKFPLPVFPHALTFNLAILCKSNKGLLNSFLNLIE
jgi:hypothetical protein